MLNLMATFLQALVQEAAAASIAISSSRAISR